MSEGLPDKPRRRRARGKRNAFLAAYSACASITAAAEACGIHRATHYEWMEDRDYAARFEIARDIAAQRLEDEAVRRAFEGVFEPVVYQGGFTYEDRFDPNGFTEHIDPDGVVTYTAGRTTKSEKPLGVFKHADGLMMFLLRGMMPEKYRDKSSVEHAGPGGGPIVIDRAKFAALSDEELGALITISKKLAPPEDVQA